MTHAMPALSSPQAATGELSVDRSDTLKLSEKVIDYKQQLRAPVRIPGNVTAGSGLEMGAYRKHEYHGIDIDMRFGGDIADLGFCPGIDVHVPAGHVDEPILVEIHIDACFTGESPGIGQIETVERAWILDFKLQRSIKLLITP